MRTLVLLTTLLVGCDAAGSPVDAAATRDAGHDASTPRDAGPPLDASLPDLGTITFPDGATCEGPIELGRCARADGTGCDGTPGEPATFVALAPGDPVPLVVGPQGSAMLVLAARTRGIDPGDPTMPASRANPTVEIHVHDATGLELAVYQGRTTFAPDASDSTLLVQPSFFVVVDGALDRFVGTLTADAMLHDAAGSTRCGTVDFTPTR